MPAPKNPDNLSFPNEDKANAWYYYRWTKVSDMLDPPGDQAPKCAARDLEVPPEVGPENRCRDTLQCAVCKMYHDTKEGLAT